MLNLAFAEYLNDTELISTTKIHNNITVSVSDESSVDNNNYEVNAS